MPRTRLSSGVQRYGRYRKLQGRTFTKGSSLREISGGCESAVRLVQSSLEIRMGRPGARPVTIDRHVAAIRSDAVVLAASDPALAGAAVVAGRFAVPLRPPGFATMIWLILGQQVSIEAAQAMFDRLEATLGTVTPGGLLGLNEETMRRCGFTRQKAGYARDLAGAVTSGTFSFEEVEGLPDDQAVAALTTLRGVGVWSAENYLMWALGRRDVFPAGDLALRLGWQRLDGAADPPSADALRETAVRWSPRRTAAAFLIWHYYLGMRGRGEAGGGREGGLGGPHPLQAPHSPPNRVGPATGRAGR